MARHHKIPGIRWSLRSGRGMLTVPWLAIALACSVSEKGATTDTAAGGAAKTDAGAPAAASAAGGAGSPATIAVIRAADWVGSEWSEDAIRVGLQEEGFDEGKDFVFKMTSAQGDLATLPSLVDQALDSKARIIVALQDPTLKAAVQRVKNNTPIVFHVLADPFAAGAGRSDSSHLANVTGVYSPGFGDPEQQRRINLIKRVVPGAKRVGILFSPDEPYAVGMKDKMVSAGQRSGLEVIGVPVATVNDGPNAAATIIGRKVDAIEIFGNTAHTAFPSIIKAATDAKVPVFSPSPFEMLKGARAAVYPDFAEGGIVAGHMIGQIMKGKSPGTIPFHRLETTKTEIKGEPERTTAAAGPEAATATKRP